jgi:hypothetical protein
MGSEIPIPIRHDSAMVLAGEAKILTISFQAGGKNNAAQFTLKVHRGEGKALLVMNWKVGCRRMATANCSPDRPHVRSRATACFRPWPGFI